MSNSKSERKFKSRLNKDRQNKNNNQNPWTGKKKKISNLECILDFHSSPTHVLMGVLFATAMIKIVDTPSYNLDTRNFVPPLDNKQNKSELDISQKSNGTVFNSTKESLNTSLISTKSESKPFFNTNTRENEVCLKNKKIYTSKVIAKKIRELEKNPQECQSKISDKATLLKFFDNKGVVSYAIKEKNSELGEGSGATVSKTCSVMKNEEGWILNGNHKVVKEVKPEVAKMFQNLEHIFGENYTSKSLAVEYEIMQVLSPGSSNGICNNDLEHIIDLPFVNGKSINKAYLELKKKPFLEKCEITLKIFHKIDELHHRGISHHDINKDNILIEGGNVNIIDYDGSAFLNLGEDQVNLVFDKYPELGGLPRILKDFQSNLKFHDLLEAARLLEPVFNKEKGIHEEIKNFFSLVSELLEYRRSGKVLTSSEEKLAQEFTFNRIEKLFKNVMEENQEKKEVYRVFR